ncbi:hypothetical protein MuYL_3160 [Mucilaginibacter xinganensis]|uniref:Uncharacterized protein n=1 Tax=Mucilaginibacter xinganensis TaxID=1234841 RepID=A0A223NYV7_9SPHI|nr:hypothetical protein MuYL_3160 [Mucilaginibacter xinganensis]
MILQTAFEKTAGCDFISVVVIGIAITKPDNKKKRSTAS